MHVNKITCLLITHVTVFEKRGHSVQNVPRVPFACSLHMSEGVLCNIRWPPRALKDAKYMHVVATDFILAASVYEHLTEHDYSSNDYNIQ